LSTATTGTPPTIASTTTLKVSWTEEGEEVCRLHQTGRSAAGQVDAFRDADACARRQW
jgi:hypothetical protein